ncbi:MAG: hypothetical protein M3128_02870 [Verrucomicrobiota bacterium]|nr:hypothetical protein [Verrucomicrobiota bacterium]
MSRVPARPNSVSRFAGIVAIVVTLACGSLHIIFGLHAGGLWRDEIGSLEIATMRTFSELWSNLAFESFPALFPLLLRAVASVSASDHALRIFGVVIGLCILAALWLNARTFRIGFPLVALALIGGNAHMIRYGDSIRGYGIGILFILLSLGAFWRLVESCTVVNAMIAGLCALLSVQALYYNSVLIFAVCLGAVAVALRRKNFALVLIVLSIGAIAALSLLPYWPIIQRVHQWDFVWKVPFTPAHMWGRFSETLGSPVHALLWVWPALFLLAVIVSTAAFRRAKMEDRDVFTFFSLIVGVLGYGVFLRVLGYQTQPWYYITLMAFSALCFEIILARALLARALFALAFVGITFFPATRALHQRQTNMDLVAARLEELAAPADFIIANPFPFGIPLHHYYHGTTSIETVPPLSDLRTHRADQLVAQMRAPNPLAPVFQKMEETLRNGHTVWLVGSVPILAPNQKPLEVVPGGMSGDFYRAWGEQTASFLQLHAEQFERVRVPLSQPVMHYENVPLSSFRGWK